MKKKHRHRFVRQILPVLVLFISLFVYIKVIGNETLQNDLADNIDNFHVGIIPGGPKFYDIDLSTENPTQPTSQVTISANQEALKPHQQFEDGVGLLVRPIAPIGIENSSQGVAPPAPPPTQAETLTPSQEKIVQGINFNNVNIIEYIRFISRLTNRNFIFDENDLQFTVTIIFEEAHSLEDIMTALLQELRIHGLMIMEQGDSLIIHKNPKMGSVSKVIPADQSANSNIHEEIITKVFKLNTLESEQAASILKPLLSNDAILEPIKETNHLVVTDFKANIQEISNLLKNIDSPKSGMVIGQYVAKSSYLESLMNLGQQILRPIAGNQQLIFIPHPAANSIFIISTPFLVERSLSILKYLDENHGLTRIINPKEMNYSESEGQWELDENGNWRFRPKGAKNPNGPPTGRWIVDPQGNWYYQPGLSPGQEGPEGKWILDPNGNWVYQLNEGKSISPIKFGSENRMFAELPAGHIQRTQFYIHKLRYRNGDQISKALFQISQSMMQSGTANKELIGAINSVQWIEATNSLVITGTQKSIDKVKDLIDEIDTPLRQVFLEMLLLETTLTDSLAFSVNPSTRFGGGLTSGNQAFLSGASPLPGAMTSAGVLGPTPPPNTSLLPQTTGFSLGIVGEHISHGGTLFSTLGALVRALHTRTTMKVLLNPKILVQDNTAAEIFVGENTQFPTQTISNAQGGIITQNFEFRDVGTRLKVVPLISSNDIVTLEIQEEVSDVVSGGTQNSSNLSSQITGPTTAIARTTTRVHVPNKYFLILSGELQDQSTRNITQTPCLGAIPILGAAFKDKQVQDTKTNVLIFIRPEIIDSEAQIHDLTKRNQDIYRMKGRSLSYWKIENEEALDFLNLEDTEDSDEAAACF